MISNSSPPSVTKQKRGRRTKKEIEAANAEQANGTEPSSPIKLGLVDDVVEQEDLLDPTPFEDETLVSNEDNSNTILKATSKKRGRKPKGGKIIQHSVKPPSSVETKPNIILHLKCSVNDLDSSGDHNSNFTMTNVDPYNFESGTDLNYEVIDAASTVSNQIFALMDVPAHGSNHGSDVQEDDNRGTDRRELWRKLKLLEKDLHINNISDKKSACFWCSYDFDNPPVYIPKHFIKDTYHVYGSFCTPECAVAYLMQENLDSSTKFERYHLMNNIYSKIYDYKKSIKPAPDPHYMLEKFFGNLKIQEYRTLLRSERLFLIVDKPLTRILPEFHEDNDDFIINNKIIPSNNYQVKRRPQKKPAQSKSTIMNEKFGIQSAQ